MIGQAVANQFSFRLYMWTVCWIHFFVFMVTPHYRLKTMYNHKDKGK